MNKKDKELLSLLYEMEHWKPVTKLLASVKKDIVDRLLSADATSPDFERNVIFLQGQAYALKSFEAKVKQIHKESVKD